MQHIIYFEIYVHIICGCFRCSCCWCWWCGVFYEKMCCSSQCSVWTGAYVCSVFIRASSTHPAESWRRSAKLRTYHRSHPITTPSKAQAQTKTAAAVIAMSVVATAAAAVAVEAAADSSVVLHVFLEGGDQRSRNPSRGPSCRDAFVSHHYYFTCARKQQMERRACFAPSRRFLRVSLCVACSQIRCYQLQQTCAHRL